MKRVLITIMLVSSFLVHSFSQSCEPTDAQENTVNKAIAMVKLPLFQFTGVLVNNINEDGRLLFLTSSYPFRGNCPDGYNYSGHISNIEFTWIDGTVTSGATIVATGSSGEDILLELDEAPFETYSLLGVNTTLNPSHCITNYGGVLKKLDADEVLLSTPATISTNCGNNTLSYSTQIQNSLALIVNKWSGGAAIYKSNYGKGSPLMSGNLVSGMYVHKFVQNDTCGIDSAYFVRDISGMNLAARGITFTPCVSEELKDLPLNTNEIVMASIRVIGRSVINANVTFRAGEEVLLEDGFDSGTNFIAEIVPCIAESEVIASKTNEPKSMEYLESIVNHNQNPNAKVYPTVIVNDVLTIETDNLETYNYVVINVNGQVIRDNINIKSNLVKIKTKNLQTGFYFLKIYTKEFQKTFKIIKQ